MSTTAIIVVVIAIIVVAVLLGAALMAERVRRRRRLRTRFGPSTTVRSMRPVAPRRLKRSSGDGWTDATGSSSSL